MYEHNALGYGSDLALCLTKVRSSRACCPATALITFMSRINFSLGGPMAEWLRVLFLNHSCHHCVWCGVEPRTGHVYM